MSDEPVLTDEMRERVKQELKREECMHHGHSFSQVMTMGSLAPTLTLCTNCGASWRIHPEDAGKDFG